MHVVHAAWLTKEGTLRLWAERSPSAGLEENEEEEEGDVDDEEDDDEEDDDQEDPAPLVHPFSADPALLRSFARASGLDDDDLPDPELVVVLPAGEGGPLPSPELSAEAAQPTALLPFVVPSLALAPAAALELLAHVEDQPGTRAARSLRHLARVAAFARQLVQSGSVVPLVEENGASWEPILDPTSEALRTLWDRLPPSTRAALSVEDAGTHDDLTLPSARDLVTSLLGALVDAECRSALARGRFVGNVPRQAQKLIAPFADDDSEVSLGSAHRERWKKWAAPARRGRQPARLLFRLAPPPEDPGASSGKGDWRVELLLQSHADPSLVVEPAQLRGGKSVPGLGAGAPLAELFLAELGRALRLFPELDRALGGALPGAVSLKALEAFAFLKERAPALAEAGFGVVVPAWWGEPSRRLGVRVQSRGATRSGPSGVPLFAYDLRVALGDETLTEEELRALAAAKAPLVRVRGRWVELDPGDVERALRLLDRHPGGELTAAELLQLASGTGGADLGGLPVVDVRSEGGPRDEVGPWKGDLVSTLLEGERALGEMPTPAGFAGRLRPYQARGLAWLTFLEDLGLGACLADDMGLGKTVQLLALLEAEREDRRREASGARGRGTLLVCPLSVVENWRAEAARFAPALEVYVHHGLARQKGEALAGRLLSADLVVTTYALVDRDLAALGGAPWRRVVLDEAQQVKNPGARQTRAVCQLEAGRRIALTGTPVENRLVELWSIFRFLNPGLLGGEKAFVREFARPIEQQGNAERAAALRRVTGPLLLRRLKTDRTIIDDLPPKIEVKERCFLSREQASLYEAVVVEMLQSIEESEGIERRGRVLAGLLRLKQICDHPALFLGDGSRLEGRSPKLARLEELLEGAQEGGERTLVFTQFATMGGLLARHLEERFLLPVGFLHGGTSKAQRDRLVKHFDDEDGPFALVVSLKAGGTGLNLTRASRVVHFDRWWNPAVEDQATDRAFRIGQKKRVLVHKLVTHGTLEERIDALIEQKRALAERVVGTGEGWLTELDTSALREVLALAPGAVAPASGEESA